MSPPPPPGGSIFNFLVFHDPSSLDKSRRRGDRMDTAHVPIFSGCTLALSSVDFFSFAVMERLSLLFDVSRGLHFPSILSFSL